MFFSLVAVATLVHALAVQVPLSSGQRWQDEYSSTTTLTEKDLAEWDLNLLPNPNATNHLVFETVHSLLQHWPNTRMRNGHNIVPGVIPNGTLLYHGQANKELPTGPEWIATDPEHSYLFCRNLFNSSEPQRGGWHLTLMATRPLKMIYFDGSSAVKFPYGSMDTQDLITSGIPSEGKNIWKEEMKRVKDLCGWGKNFGVDGLVRMEMDFEIILCDFASGVSVVSFEHIASGSSMYSSVELFEVMNSGAWHNRFPGETRIKLDLPGLISFYDTQLASSLVPIRAGQERWDHRAINISSAELSAMKSRLEANLIKHDGASSGIDWETLLQVVVDRYADRLELTRYLLNSPATDTRDILDFAKKAQAQLRIMLTPYILFSAAPTSQLDKTELDWTIPIFKLCATTHTRSMETQFESMTDSEKLLLRAVRGTSREICRVVTKMWAAGVYAGIDSSLNTMESPDIAEVTRLREIWAEELERLMAWLDWNVWIKCNPGCDFEETCYLPTWPVGFPWLATEPAPVTIPTDDYVPDGGMTSLTLRTMVMQNLANEVRSTIKPEPDEWIRPQPKCIRRVAPYRY